MKHNLLKTLIIIGASTFYSSAALADIKLVFGTYTADKPTETVKKFKPFLDFLSQEMTEHMQEPVTIKMKIAKSYDEGINNLVTGKVDFARFGPASYVTAKAQNPDLEIIAMESKKGKKTFKGIIAIHTDSKTTKITQLKGQSFAFGDELSTIGRYLAQQELVDANVYAKDLKNYAYLGRHDFVGTAVANKLYDAGALKESTFNKLVKKNASIKKLIDFDNVTKPWISSATMEKNVFQAMQNIMMNNKDAPEIKTIAKSGFLLGTDSDYNSIRSAIEKSEQF